MQAGDQTVTRATVLLVAVALSVRIVITQSRVDDGWRTAWNNVQNLTVMLGQEGRCGGAGIVSGADAARIYIVTAYHVIREWSPAPAASVRVRSSRTGQPLVTKTVVTAVVRSDPAADIAVLAADDVDVVRAFQSDVRFDVLGDGANLQPGDSTYAIGCGEGVPWDKPPQLESFIASSAAQGSISFETSYIREGFSGGPLLHVFNATSFLVGMTRGGPPRAQAVDAAVIVSKLAEWNLPVQLRPAGTTLECTYLLSTKRVVLGSSRGSRAAINVTTEPQCEWHGYSDGTPWLNPSYSTVPYVPRHGSDVLTVTATSENPCESKSRHGTMLVAGQLVIVDQDFSGSATNTDCK